jgi:dienelactone hydrolase
LRHDFNVLPCILPAEPSKAASVNGSSGQTPAPRGTAPRSETRTKRRQEILSGLRISASWERIEQKFVMGGNCFRRKHWLISLGAALGVTLIAGCSALHDFLHVPTWPLPEGVDKRSQKLVLTGESVKVDFYFPRHSNSAPVVVIAHGFSRNRKTMAGWGGLLAEQGFIAVAPDLPTWADHGRNGRAVAELLAEVQSGNLIQQPKPSGLAALVGFSAGGMATLLAASGNTNVSCWIGLDPVGKGSETYEAAALLEIPCFVLRAEPSRWNAHGNARQIFAALPGPAFSLVVNQASHVDAENPTSRAADWACGRSDPERRAVFGRYLLAGLRVGLLRNEASFNQLSSATNDAAVHEVQFQKVERFQLAH